MSNRSAENPVFEGPRCATCQMSFASKEFLEDHMVSVHAPRRPRPPCPRHHLATDYYQFNLPFLAGLGLSFDEQALVLSHREHVKAQREFRCHGYNGYTYHFCGEHPAVVA